MAGLGRVQQRFNAAVVAALTLLSFGPRGQKAAEKQFAVAQGMPLAAKYMRSNALPEVRSKYQPHIGERQRARARRQIDAGFIPASMVIPAGARSVSNHTPTTGWFGRLWRS